jgi:hypothetical protein
MNDYLRYDYLPAFANTVVIELGVALLCGLWSLRHLGAVVLVNFVTHPALHVVLWTVFWREGLTESLPVQLALEVAVVLAEGALLWRWLLLPLGKALALSAAMNTTSYLIGFALVG